MDLKKEYIDYYDQSFRMRGYATYHPSKKRPALIICHPWFGQDDFSREKAVEATELGCVGFAADLYGEGLVASSKNEASKLKDELMTHRHLIHSRLNSAIDAVKKIPYVNPKQIAVLGYCFGGACAIELARSGSDIKAIISYHGNLNRDQSKPIQPIKSSLLIFHGHDDPLVPQQEVLDFQKEMTEAQADWQLMIFGKTMHGFTNPRSQAKEEGLQYSKLATLRSWRITKRFLRERFEEELEVPSQPIMA